MENLEARPPTRRAARRARSRIQHALHAQQELEEAIELAVMEQQAREYAMFQRIIEEEERRREEQMKEEAVAWSEKMVDLVEENQIYKVGLNLEPKDKECSICFKIRALGEYDGASMCGKAKCWICLSCFKNMLVKAYIKASSNTFAVPCPYCREEQIFNKSIFN